MANEVPLTVLMSISLFRPKTQNQGDRERKRKKKKKKRKITRLVLFAPQPNILETTTWPRMLFGVLSLYFWGGKEVV